MTDKQIRGLYIAVKIAMLAVALALLIGGMQAIDAGEKVSAAIFCWLSGVLMWAFATLEE